VTYEPAPVVEVRAWGATVGAVAFDPGVGAYAFEYADEWRRGVRELSPFLMPNRPGPYVFPDLNPVTFQRLPPMLADALPDRFGNALVDAWMAEQGVPRSAITPLDRLAYAADRTMGALEFRPPARDQKAEITAIQLADLVTAARAAVTGNLHDAAADVLHELIEVGTSAGGARAKAVIAFNPDTWEVRSGQVETPPGFEHWLIKLDGVSGDPSRETDPFTAGAGYGRLEFAYSRMASAAGVEMAECRLFPEGPRAHFVTQRFDRGPGGERIHMQTLCGIAALDFNAAGAHSYAQYLDTILSLGLDTAAVEQGYRRVVFNVAAANCDDHTKNLAFLCTRDGEWALAPAYDVTHAHNPRGEWTSRHQMTVNGKREGISVADLHQLADRFGVPDYKGATRAVLAAVDRWREFADEAGVDADHTERVAADLADVRPR
jgi:serine/threonine-protein kinase HipA